MKRKIGLSASLASLVSLSLVVGCGDSGPDVHAVTGTVVLTGGDLRQFAGSTVEVARVDDELVRGFGQVDSEGTFHLQSLIGGELRDGVLEGQYRARIIPNDEDGAARQAAASQLDKQYLNYQSSGLELTVPATGNVQLSLRPGQRSGVRR